MDKQDIENGLKQFSGSQEFFLHTPTHIISEGVKWLADNTGCYWLMDAIVSYHTTCMKDKMLQDMQFWTLKVNPDKSAILICERDTGEYVTYWNYFPIRKVSLNTLKSMELWNYLTEELKKDLETRTPEEDKQELEANKETVKVTHKRNHDFDDLPRSLSCSTRGCDGTMHYISPTMLIQRAKDKNITPEEYCKIWKCSECDPKPRGKKANPNSPWFGKTKELKCSCGTILIQQPSLTYRLAEKLGLSYDDYVNQWKCKNCKGDDTTTTTTRRGRKMAPDSPWIGKAKELKCTNPECGKIQPQHASITDAQAKKVGKTFEDYVSTWKCRKCRPVGEKRIVKGRGRVANPAWKDIPKEIACVSCSKVVKLAAQNIIDKAAILGMSVEDLLKSYKCRSCGGRLPRNSRSKLEEVA